MAEQTSSGGGNSVLAFIVGGLVVIVAVLGFLMWSGGMSPKKQVDVNISASAPKLPDAPASKSPGG